MDTLTQGSFIWLEALYAERNVARRYTVALSRDLIGASIVEFAWGRIGTRGGGGRSRLPARVELHTLLANCCAAEPARPNEFGVPYREVSL